MKARNGVALVLGSFLIVVGLCATTLVFLSAWSLLHGWPILVISIPAFVFGLVLFRFGRARNSKG
jgi:hypothetical protein